jgi:hypothetical protein
LGDMPYNFIFGGISSAKENSYLMCCGLPCNWLVFLLAKE